MARRGRPTKEIDEEQLYKLATYHCTVDEMASFFNVHKRTLERNYAAVIDAGRNSGKMSLRKKRWELALDGNIALIIFLSKVVLGESDKEPEQKQASQPHAEEVKRLTARLESVIREANVTKEPFKSPLPIAPNANGLLPIKA